MSVPVIGNSSSNNPPRQNEIVPSNFSLFNNRLPSEMTIHILSFLDDSQLRIVDTTGRFFRPLINIVCVENAWGADVYERNLGKVDTTQYPRHFIERSRLGGSLLCPSGVITREFDENSPIELPDETDEMRRSGNRPRLFINTSKIATEDRPGLEPSGRMKTLVIPFTLLNVLFLAEHCPMNGPSQFAGIWHAYPNILDQHGDKDVEPTHWTLQIKPVKGRGENFAEQVEQAKAHNYEIVSLVDRVLFGLLSYLKTGKFPQRDYVERTSTSVIDNNGKSWQSATWWPASGPSFRLDLDVILDGCDDDGVGVAVGVPAGSS